MNITHAIVLIGILAFAVGSSLVPALRAGLLHRAESHKTISDGLTGPWHWFEDVGFTGLAAALVVLACALSNWASWLAGAVGTGVIGAMVTDSFRPTLMSWFKWTSALCERLHLTSAGIAFVGALFLEGALSWLSPSPFRWVLWVLVAWYPLSVGLVRLIWPKYTAWQEKTAAAAIVEYLIVWSVL